jgi:thymidylate synthase ThyX
LKQAAGEPAHDVNHAAARELLQEVQRESPSVAARAADHLLRSVRVAPTLIKYAEPSAYELQTRHDLDAAAGELLHGIEIQPAPLVDLLDPEPLEVELATTLLYHYSHHPYRQIREAVEGLSAARRQEIVDLGIRYRGGHDEVSRAYAAGQHFRFDILMDIGSFRDMHRHRRCVQILQDYSVRHGYDMPQEVAAAGLAGRYSSVMERTRDAAKQLAAREADEAEQQSQYVIPLAFRKRALFKMDLAEAIYISELRTGAAGHFSYRNVAYAMYEAVARRYPALARHFRVTDVREPADLLKR